VGTANVCSRAPAYPPFNVALRERGLTAIHGRRPDQEADRIGFPIRRSEDHIPNRIMIELLEPMIIGAQ
jgi:hypothetical protein